MKTIKGSNSKQYSLEKVIGQGSFGKVYLSGKYAVKEISLEMPPYLKEQLKNQIKILKSFNHPNIVSLIDVVEEPKYAYLVMEYCEMDLAKYIKKIKLDENKAKKILKQIICGFRELVAKGIIHRDLKPANILVNSKSEFKLADFGFAKFVDHFDSKLLHSIVGTPLYMAPQILDKKNYTTKCDIWSIGFIFYELLTSRHPWTGYSQSQLKNNIRKKPLQIPSFISEWSSTLLKRMLVIDEDKRIGWDQLIKYVLAPQKSNGSNQGSERQISLPKQLQKRNSLKQQQQPPNLLQVKASDLLLVFQLQLLDYFPQQKASAMVNEKNYRYSVSDIGIIRKVLGNFTENFQKFIEGYINLKV